MFRNISLMSCIAGFSVVCLLSDGAVHFRPSFKYMLEFARAGYFHPCYLSVYIDVLISRLRQCRLGCKVLQQYFGCIIYADDISLLSHSLTAMRAMLDICEKFAYEFDDKFNSLKSTVARISDRFDAVCTPNFGWI